MTILNACGLIGIGYILNDWNKYRPKFYSQHKETLRNYFTNVIMDKMDVLFYGSTEQNRNRVKYRPKYNYTYTINKSIKEDKP